jgi:hypothetical protein
VQLLDVPLLALTLGHPMPRAQLAGNIRAYLAAFEGGAAFSYAVNALAAAEVGRLVGRRRPELVEERPG